MSEDQQRDGVLELLEQVEFNHSLISPRELITLVGVVVFASIDRPTIMDLRITRGVDTEMVEFTLTLQGWVRDSNSP